MQIVFSTCCYLYAYWRTLLIIIHISIPISWVRLDKEEDTELLLTYLHSSRDVPTSEPAVIHTNTTASCREKKTMTTEAHQPITGLVQLLIIHLVIQL